ncbi:IucA/IucC family protein [Microtetraspora niveoalba]|uniref:IucA/IucC family protein n=1 Tax=Microtetraspora niveoalba TaxID=46175 RepID=UPI000AFC5AC2|nr:IucA/IucC family protein [Microtetraspora niveoalba]
MSAMAGLGPVGREPYLAGRVLNALLREDFAGMASRLERDREGVALVLASGRRVRLAPGGLFQDFSIAPEVTLTLAEVLETLEAVATPADAAGVAAFAAECHETLAALELYDRHGKRALERARGPIRYEALAAAVDHPVYPTARCRLGVPAEGLLAYAPEFAPAFELRWAAVRRERVTLSPEAEPLPGLFPRPADVGLPGGLADTHLVFPVHPLALPVVAGIPGVIVAGLPHLRVRPTLSMRTVAAGERLHLKLPIPTSTLGLRNRRSIKPSTLRDGALAERLLRDVLRAEPDLPVLLADEQLHGHAGHEYLGWMIRRLPPGEIVPVAALAAPGVLPELAARFYGGEVGALLRDYLTILFAWNVRLFVRYGIALEAHQQNLSLLFADGAMRLLVKDNDGLLAAPDRLAAAGLAVPDFADERMLTDDPHSLADVFVTITLHLAAAAITFGAVEGAAGLVRDTLDTALAEFGEHPMARLLRARTLDAARLVGKSMVTAATLVDKERTGARDVNKFYGTSGPNYLRFPR